MAIDLTGKMLGPFFIEGRVGQGAMGTVYRAKHVKTGKISAIKVMGTTQDKVSPTHAARFEREIKLLSQFRHANIVRIYGASESDGIRYYAMELIDGRTLEEILYHKRKLTFKRTIAYAIQICDALQEIHRTGVIHRDLKPGNLMVTGDHQLKLTDFGIAKDLSAAHSTQLTQADHTVGTVAYMSPEQLAGSELTRRSDIYSFGIITYQMLTGQLPFTGQTVFEYIKARMTGTFTPASTLIPEVPLEFDDLIESMLEKNPEDRPQDALVVMQRLLEIVKKVRDGTLASASESKQQQPESFAATVALETRPTGRLRNLAHRVTSSMTTMGKRKRKRLNAATALESPWFLGACVAAIIAFVAYMLWPLGPDALFARGQAMMSDGSTYIDWENAMRKYFDPLMEKYPENQYKEEIGAIRDKIALEKARGKANRILRLGLKSDIENDVPAAQKYIDAMTLKEKMGDNYSAQEQLKALIELYGNDPAQRGWVRLAEEQLAQQDEFKSDEERIAAKRKLVEDSIKRGDELRADKKIADSAAVYESVVKLYGSDKEVEDLVGIARTRLGVTE